MSGKLYLPLLHRLGFALLNMGVVAIQNSVTPKTRFIGKLLTKIRLILNRPLLPVNVIVWLQCLHPLNMIEVKPLLSKTATNHKLRNLNSPCIAIME
jgi:hypothetical protein